MSKQVERLTNIRGRMKQLQEASIKIIETALQNSIGRLSKKISNNPGEYYAIHIKGTYQERVFHSLLATGNEFRATAFERIYIGILDTNKSDGLGIEKDAAWIGNYKIPTMMVYEYDCHNSDGFHLKRIPLFLQTGSMQNGPAWTIADFLPSLPMDESMKHIITRERNSPVTGRIWIGKEWKQFLKDPQISSFLERSNFSDLAIFQGVK